MMTDPITAGILVILLILLTFVWTYPLIRKEVQDMLLFRVFKAGVHLVAGFVLLWIGFVNWKIDLFQILKILSGFLLLYEGAITILNVQADIRRSKIREKEM